MRSIQSYNNAGENLFWDAVGRVLNFIVKER